MRGGRIDLGSARLQLVIAAACIGAAIAVLVVSL